MSGSYPEGSVRVRVMLFSPIGEIKTRKKVAIILKISKQEMEYLQSKGVPFGENGIVHTTARHRRTYYMSETKRNSQLLGDYRKPIIK